MPVRLDHGPARTGGSGKLARGTEFATQIPQITRKPHLEKTTSGPLFDISRQPLISLRPDPSKNGQWANKSAGISVRDDEHDRSAGFPRSFWPISPVYY